MRVKVIVLTIKEPLELGIFEMHAIPHIGEYIIINEAYVVHSVFHSVSDPGNPVPLVEVCVYREVQD